MVRQSGLATFFSLTFAFTWLLWGLAHPGIQKQLGLSLSAGLFLGLGTAVPSLVALGLSARRADAGKLLSGLFRWRVHPSWYAVALIGPPTVMITSTAIHVALGGAWPDYPATERWPLFTINFVAVLIIGGPLGEELGWRAMRFPG